MNTRQLSLLTGMDEQDVNKFMSLVKDMSLSTVCTCTKDVIPVDIYPYGTLYVDVHDVNSISIQLNDQYKQTLLKCLTQGYDPMLVRLENSVVNKLKSKYEDVLGD